MHKNILKNVKSAFIVLLTLVCLSFAFANRALAQATNIATKTIQVNGQSYTVRVLESNKERKEISSVGDIIHYMGCSQQRMDDIYKSACYPCKVVKSLISVFLNGCKYLEGTSKEAGQKVLILGFMLWVAFYVIRQVSSFKNIEPASMVNDLLIMAFKIMLAWVVIAKGYSIFVDYMLVPFLGWGIDFGTQLLVAGTTSTGLDISGTQVESSYLLGPDYDGLLPPHLLNNLMTYIGAVDATVTNHLKIGHMITCHSTHAGAWGFPEYGLSIPNFWMWLCGAAIWIVGFCMTFSVLFYLVDMSFKLGFALVALPIVTGLWPFGMTKGKLKICFNIILNASGTFIFLAMTTACGLVLVDSALAVGQGIMDNTITDAVARAQGTQTLFSKIEAGDTEATADMFSIFSSSFFVLVFAYLYAIKIIGSTVSDYVDVFFDSDGLGSPMHRMFTRSVDVAKEQMKKRLKRLKNAAKAGLKDALSSDEDEDGEKDEGLFDKVEKFNNKLNNLQKGKFNEEEPTKKQSGADTAMSITNMKAKDGEKMDKDAGIKGGKDDGSNAATQALESVGEGLEKTGQAMKDAANAVQNTGRAIDNVGTAAGVVTFGTAKAATTAARVGTETSAAATKVGAEAMIMAGKVLKKTAKVLKKVNKIAKKVQKVTKKVSKAANKVKKVAQKAQKAVGGGSDENKENKNNESQNQNQNPLKNATEGSDKQKMREESDQGLVGSMAKTAAGGNKDEN